MYTELMNIITLIFTSAAIYIQIFSLEIQKLKKRNKLLNNSKKGFDQTTPHGISAPPTGSGTKKLHTHTLTNGMRP